MESLALGEPWAAFLLPLPLLFQIWVRSSREALRVPSLNMLVPSGFVGTKSVGLHWFVKALALLSWLFLVLALMRPILPDSTAMPPASGREMMLVLDVSPSMGTKDMRLGGAPASRLEVAQRLADSFLKTRSGDRMGLVFFGARATLHAPLTFDGDAVRLLLYQASPGMVGSATSLGDALALAVGKMREYSNSARVLVVMTDGAHNAGALSPEQALWLAQREGVRIFAVGLGAERLSVVTATGVKVIDPSTGLDEPGLRKLAKETGGEYLRASDSAGLAAFFARIGEAEPPVSVAAPNRPQGRDLYPGLLGIALVFGVAWLVVDAWGQRRRIAP